MKILGFFKLLEVLHVVTSSKLGWFPVEGIVEAFTSRCWPNCADDEELVFDKDLITPLEEPIEDLGSFLELPKDGSCGAGSGGVDGAWGYEASVSIPVHMLLV